MDAPGERGVDPIGADDLLVGTEDSLTLSSSTPNMYLGVSLAAADVDGDGFVDLVVGTQQSDGVEQPQHTGGVYVLFGGEQVFAQETIAVDPPDVGPDRLAAITATDTAIEVGFGGTVAAGDLDGDGKAEVAVTVGRFGSFTLPHSVVVMRGQRFADYRSSGAAADLLQDAMVLREAFAGSAFGARLDLADVNNDRQADLIIGAPMETTDASPTVPNGGAAYFILGSVLSDYFGGADIDLIDYVDQTIGTPRIGVVVLQGQEPNGWFGLSTAVSSNLPQTALDPPHAYTYILWPGIDGFSGAIHYYHLPSLLPCRSLSLCEERSLRVGWLPKVADPDGTPGADALCDDLGIATVDVTATDQFTGLDEMIVTGTPCDAGFVVRESIPYANYDIAIVPRDAAGQPIAVTPAATAAVLHDERFGTLVQINLCTNCSGP